MQEWRHISISVQRPSQRVRWPELAFFGWRALAGWLDHGAATAVALAALLVYLQTLLPGLGSRDTAELQRVVPTLGLAHPTGYPLYTILGWAWEQLPLGGTPALRLNMFSAATAALGAAVLFYAARAIGQARPVAGAAALSLALSRAFWSQATIAEVYALAALIQALLLLALLRWRTGRWPLWPVGLLLGLGLAHHRTIVLMLPGALLFFIHTWFTARHAKTEETDFALRPLRSLRFISFWHDIALATLALLAGCLLYVYVPLRAPEWMHTWGQVWAHISGAKLSGLFFDPARLRAEGLVRPLDLARRFIVPQFGAPGLAFMLVGIARVLRRDRALAALLIVSYTVVCGFCAAYYVDDVEVFFIPAHLLAALLIGEGAMAVLDILALWWVKKQAHEQIWRQGDGETRSNWRAAPCLPVSLSACLALCAWALFLLPISLLWTNLPAIRFTNSSADEQAARAIMAQPLPQGALVLGDWYATEGPRYLQAIEGMRPDLQISPAVGRGTILEALAHGRAVYLTKPDLGLGLAQTPRGPLWQVGSAPLAVVTLTQLSWEDGIRLGGYTLPRGRYAPGAVVPVTLQWEAYAAPRRAYSLFVHLVGPDGSIWGQADAPPTGAPTDHWRPGDRAIELAAPKLRADAPPGRYIVTLGWYEAASGHRPALIGAGADFATLGEIEVAAAQ